LVRRDREGSKSGGGVAIYVRDGLPFRVRNDLNIDENECLWIELNRAKCKPTLICCLYRAPNADFTKFISNLENCMPTLNLDRCDLIILGDMNVDLLLKPAYGCKLNMQILHNFMRSLDLSQIITEPTRITEQSKSLIDVILVNNEYRVVDSGVVPLSISDHSLIYCIVKAGFPKATPRTIEYRSYRGFDENAFIQDLNNVPWHIVDDENNVNEQIIYRSCGFSRTA